MIHTRRSFLQRGLLLGTAMAPTVPSFIGRTMAGLVAAASARSSVQAATGRDHPILVLVQLAGGNDGLNTLVPFEDDHYHRARPRLAFGADDVLRAGSETGLHPELRFFHRQISEGGATIVQNVGYPNPSRSHFVSMEIWERGGDSTRLPRGGWIGRYFDHACQGADPHVGVTMTRDAPPVFQNESGFGVSLAGFENLDFRDPREDALDLYEELNTPESGPGAAMAQGDDPVAFLRRVALDARVSARHLEEIRGRYRPGGGYPGGFGHQLREIAGLIGGGLDARVYYASLGGFDTHSNQAGAHAACLRTLDRSLAAFWRDIREQGNDERVMVMTFSEFGRRVHENESAGTDHGAAAPLFLLGGGRRHAGVYGANPNLAPDALDRGDVAHQVDFRQVYATVLRDCLGTDPAPIIGGEHQPVDFFGV